MGLLLHTMATPELDPVGALQLAARLGFDGLELICQDNYPCGISVPQKFFSKNSV